MVDRINTGGLKTIKSTNPSRDLELEHQVELGYQKAAERKRRNRIMLIIGIIILIVIGIGYLFLK